MAPATTSEELLSIDNKHHLQVYKRYPIVLKKGRGARAWDEEGNEYIDALAGIAVNSVGHCHSRVVEAVKKQAETLMHVSNFFASEPQVRLAETLTERSGLDRIFFTNSGAEAVEGAFKLARKYAHTHDRGGKIIALEGCFHGRTIATVAAGKEKYQKGFGPMPEGFSLVPRNDIKSLEQAIDKQTAAVIIEPIQGEGGIQVAEKEYLQNVRKLCDDKGVTLILDEIQCGMGRTGHMFAFEDYGIQPDMITLAKALGGGTPIGCFLMKEKIAETIDYGEHGTTFGGNPLVTAAALATINVIDEENLTQQAADKGDRLRENLEELAQNETAIKEVRGKGLMIGVELEFEGQEVVQEMLSKGVISNCAANTVIRLVPPLNISNDDLDVVVDTLKEAIQEVK